MTREEALTILDTIPTIGEQVDALDMAIEALEADALEVVRCKDCKLWRYVQWADEYRCTLRASAPFSFPLSTAYKTEPEDFCSYGERSEE